MTKKSKKVRKTCSSCKFYQHYSGVHYVCKNEDSEHFGHYITGFHQACDVHTSHLLFSDEKVIIENKSKTIS